MSMVELSETPKVRHAGLIEEYQRDAMSEKAANHQPHHL